MQDEIKNILNDAVSQVDKCLNRGVDQHDATKIIRQYTAAIEGNFVSWMGATAISARSIQGRYAASENLWVEMRDDHAGMLRTFAQCAKSEPNIEDYQCVSKEVTHIRQLVAQMSGLKNLTLMAVLENTSAVFIPWLEQLATQLGSENTDYTKIHGDADIEHAEQFRWALLHEAKHYEHAVQEITATTETTTSFLIKILSA